MKFTLQASGAPSTWTGQRPLPPEIHVLGTDTFTAEWELLLVLAQLHGFMTAYDVLAGYDAGGTDNDRDVAGLFDAFRAYLGGRLPYTRYDAHGARIQHGATNRPKADP